MCSPSNMVTSKLALEYSHKSAKVVTSALGATRTKRCSEGTPHTNPSLGPPRVLGNFVSLSSSTCGVGNPSSKPVMLRRVRLVSLDRVSLSMLKSQLPGSPKWEESSA